MKKLLIITTHPIQYYAPLFKSIAQQDRIELKVIYTWGKGCLQEKYDPDFKKVISWDLPLLGGYSYEFAENIAANPGSHHSDGIINPYLISQVKANSPDFLLIFGYAYHSHFRVMKYFKGKIPILFRGDSTLLDKESFIKSLAKLVYLRYVYSKVDKVLYVGTENKKYFKKYGINDKQLHFMPHAVDNDRFSQYRIQEVATLKTELGIKEHDFVILYSGKLEPKKNPNLLLQTFLKLERPDLHLIFVGSGVQEKELKELSYTQTKFHQIHFLGFQNQSMMPVFYQMCDVYCLPSSGPQETWGLAVNEAMAAGKAVLVSNKVGCSTDLVKNGINGYIFDNSLNTDFEIKFESMLNKDKCNTFGNESKKIIADWSITDQVTQLNKIINEY